MATVLYWNLGGHKSMTATRRQLALSGRAHFSCQNRQLRTFQRWVKEWRLKKVSRELEVQTISGHNTEEGTNEQSKILA